jgi:GTP-binding protein Era
MSNTKCGYIAIIGRPNVGKSTLLNNILGEKLSITCRKPQTTRHQIMGIKTTEETQFIFVDTPGVHTNSQNALNHYMNKAAESIIDDVHVVLFLIESNKWTDVEDRVFKRLSQLDVPIIVAINKADMIKDKSIILPLIGKINQVSDKFITIPISAESGKNIPELEKIIEDCLPDSEFYYDPDLLTDRSDNFLVSEIIREKLMRSLGDEIPYQLTVEINQFKYDEIKEITDISATILVERKQQKAMVIGKGGSKLKEVGSSARVDIEKLIETKVYLQLWVKVKEGWADSEASIKNLGYY